MKSLRSTRLNESVQDQIRMYIIQHGLKPGDLIPTEKALGEALGISRTSIREALRSLEAVGSIETRHGVGRFVREFNYDALVSSLTHGMQVSVKNFDDIIAVRMALEHTFITRSIPLLTPEDIQTLRMLLQRMSDIASGDTEEDELISVHTEFHLALYKPLNNQLLTTLIEMFSTLQRSLTHLREYRTSDLGDFIQLHARLVDALEERDVELAELRLQEHFKDVISWSSQKGWRSTKEDTGDRSE